METEIKIREFFTGIKKRIWLIIAISCLSAMLGDLYSLYQARNSKPIFQSTSTYLLQINRPELTSAISFIAKDQIVLDQVGQKLGLLRSTDALKNQITITLDAESPVLKITAADPSPDLAAKIANTTGTVILQQIGNLFGIYDNKLLSDAKPAKYPVSTKPSNKMGLGLAAGAVLGIGLALLLESIDDTVQSARDLEQLLSVPVLGSVSKLNRKMTAGKNKIRESSAGIAKGGSTLNAFSKEISSN